MRRLIITTGVTVALTGCTLSAPSCAPTSVQPAHGAPVTPIGRVAGCSDLVAVAGEPGTTLYVLRVNLALSDQQIDALPLIQRGEE